MMAECILDNSGISVSSHKNLSIEEEGGYDKIMNHLILCDPKAFATPDTLVKHMKELETQVDIYVHNSLQYCELIKDKPELFIETRRRRSKVRLVTKQYLDHANIILRHLFSSHEINGGSLVVTNNALSTMEVTQVTNQCVDHANIILRPLLSSHEIDGGSLPDTNNFPSTDEVTHATKQSVEHTDIVLSTHEANGMSLIDNDDGIDNDFVESLTNLSNITPRFVPVLDNLEPISREATVLDLSSIEWSTQVALTLKSSALILKGIISQYPPYEDPVEFVPESSRPSVSLRFQPFPKHSVPDKGRRRMIKWFLPHKSVKWKMDITYCSRYLFLIIIMSRFIIIQ